MYGDQLHQQQETSSQGNLGAQMWPLLGRAGTRLKPVYDGDLGSTHVGDTA